MNILQVEPVRAGGSSKGTSPAGRLTTKSVMHYAGTATGTSVRQDGNKSESDPSESRQDTKRQNGKTRNNTRGEAGMETHGGAR